MKTVLITGASSGIGKACAQHFSQQGYFVGLYDLQAQALAETSKTLANDNYCYQACDVRDFEQVQAMFEHFKSHSQGRLDVLINCAGVLSGGRFDQLTQAQIDNIIEVNCKGLSYVAHSAFSLLKNTPKSSLVNICSASGLYGIPGLSVYSASKFYVRGFTEALNIEWQQEDIHVCSVMPPFVNTKMLQDVPQKMLDTLGVSLEPEDIAKEVFAASQSNEVHRPISLKLKALNGLGMRLPAAARKGIIRYLTTS